MTGLLKMFSSINLLAEKAITTEVNNPSFFETLWIIISRFFIDVITHVYTLAMKIIYLVMKWTMTVIDFVYTVVRQLVGINPDSSGTSFLIEDDIIFKFLSGEYFIPLMKYMIGFCLVLLIVFTIIAIIKSEYDYTVYGKDNSKKQVFVKTLQAIFLMILVPFIAIGSIIASNALLRTLVTATSLDGKGTSIGTQIFLASSYRANAYRNYAELNKKIPITYNFAEATAAENIAGWKTDGGVNEINEVVSAYMNMSVWTRGQLAFEMHYFDDYYSIDYIDGITYGAAQERQTNPNAISIYEALYDLGLYSYKPEYYLMAESIEDIFGDGRKLQFTTLEDVYKSCDSVGENNGGIVIETGSDGTKYYVAKVYYNEDINNDGNINQDDCVEYRHKEGATDEALGAVFICTMSETKKVGDSNLTYYKPYYVKNDSYRPESIYKNEDQIRNHGAATITIAKGTFTEDGYPTAIRKKNGYIECYRDNLNIPTLLDFFPTISYEKPEGVTEDIGSAILRTGFELITGVNPDELIPYIYYNFDIFSLFSKTTNVITRFTSGGLDVDYYFSSPDISMENVYSIPKIDVFILVFGVITVLNIILKAMFGLIGRIFDIVVLIISYPAALALFPLKGNKVFSDRWLPQFVSKLTGAYGIVIALNLMFLFASITNNVAIITPQDAANSLIVSILGVGFVNEIFRILFLLVAFTLLQSIPKIIHALILGGSTKDAEDVIDRGSKAVQDLKKPFEWVGDMVSGRFVMNTVSKAGQFIAGSLPGGAVVARGIQSARETRELADAFAKGFGEAKAAEGAANKTTGDSNDTPKGGTGESVPKNTDGPKTDTETPGTPSGDGSTEAAPLASGEVKGETADSVTTDNPNETKDDTDSSATNTPKDGDKPTGDKPNGETVKSDGADENMDASRTVSGETKQSGDGSTPSGGGSTPSTGNPAGDDSTPSGGGSTPETTETSTDTDARGHNNGEVNSDPDTSSTDSTDSTDKTKDTSNSSTTSTKKGSTEARAEVSDKVEIYAKLQKKKYRKFRESNGLEDNAESKKQFFDYEAALGAKSKKGKGKKRSRYAMTLDAINIFDLGKQGRMNQHIKYADKNKDDYQDYISSKGLDDDDLSKAYYYADKRNSKLK